MGVIFNLSPARLQLMSLDSCQTSQQVGHIHLSHILASEVRSCSRTSHMFASLARDPLEFCPADWVNPITEPKLQKSLSLAGIP